MESNKETKAGKILKLDEKLGTQRDRWTKKITALAHGIKTLSGMEIVIGDILHTRQLMVEQLMYVQLKTKEQKKQTHLILNRITLWKTTQIGSR